MKRKILAVTCMAATFSQFSVAETFWEQVTLVPAVGLQLKSLNFDEDLKGGGTVSGDFDADIWTLSTGVTAIYDRFYVALKYDGSINDATADSTVPFTNAAPATGGTAPVAGDGFPATDADVNRSDLSLTIGMNVWDRINVFVGYMQGETKVEPDAVSDGTSQNAAFVQKNYEQKYEEKGYFTGVSYGLPIKEIGTLSASLAYAFMDGTYEDNFNPAGSQDFEFDGDSTGFSFGLTWSSPILEWMGYYVDLRYQQYNFDGDDSNGNFAGVSVETEETILTYSAGVQFYF